MSGKDEAGTIVEVGPGRGLTDALREQGLGAADRVQVVTSGPDFRGDVMLQALGDAQRRISADEAESQFRQASRLMAHRQFTEAIAAFEFVAAAFPERRGSCENNIGACRFWLGQYEQAIVHYRRAGEFGFDEAMVRDNIEEAEGMLPKVAPGEPEQNTGATSSWRSWLSRLWHRVRGR